MIFFMSLTNLRLLLSNPSQISKINAMVTFLLLINSKGSGLFASGTAFGGGGGGKMFSTPL